MKRLLGLALLTLLVPAAPASAKHLVLVRLGSFDRPTHAASPPGDRSRLFVVEQAGRIMVIDRGRKLGTPFLDIRGRVRYDGEQGMLSMAFDPNYKANGRFYVDYVDHGGNTNVVAFRRSSRNGNRADAASGRRVLFVRNPDGEHNGGLLLFGPDRRLYIGIGDGGGVGDPHGAHGNAQNNERPARQDPPDRAPARHQARVTRSRPTTRSRARPPAVARSGPTACATRGASPSTA